ncbi:hypothetical protein NDU88_000418 [Pleurodeles waltl]|uniref:Uncharacterized protein n=1 Tax=Pleurodeles waltl TaxID=8319 RepID=A0AAV7LUK4_PLEWA|nr:hypothetical protein NDU88_000418 [Pleurodeles waltl]
MHGLGHIGGVTYLEAGARVVRIALEGVTQASRHEYSVPPVPGGSTGGAIEQASLGEKSFKDNMAQQYPDVDQYGDYEAGHYDQHMEERLLEV